MDLRLRDMIFWACVFRGLTAVEIYYGWSKARPVLDGLGYLLFCAAVIYGLGFVYDRWRIVRRTS